MGGRMWNYVVDDGGTPRLPNYAFTNATASGNTQVVAAQAGLRIRVVSYGVAVIGAVNVKFQSATTDISATFPLGAKGTLVMPFSETGWFQTNVGAALNINLSAATTTGCQVVWIQAT